MGKRGLTVKIYCKTKTSEQVVESATCPSSIFKIMTVVTEALRADICWLPRVNHVSWSRAQWRNVIIAKKKHTFHSLFHNVESNFFFKSSFLVSCFYGKNGDKSPESSGYWRWRDVLMDDGFLQIFCTVAQQRHNNTGWIQRVDQLVFHWHYKMLFWAIWDISVYSGSMVRAMLSCVLWRQTNGCP